MTANENQIVVCQPNETVWLTQSQMGELFGCSTDNVGFHPKNIYSCGKLNRGATTEESLEVQIEWRRKVSRKVGLYNFDVLITVGDCVNSIQTTCFRQGPSRRQQAYGIGREEMKG